MAGSYNVTNYDDVPEPIRFKEPIYLIGGRFGGCSFQEFPCEPQEGMTIALDNCVYVFEGTAFQFKSENSTGPTILAGPDLLPDQGEITLGDPCGSIKKTAASQAANHQIKANRKNKPSPPPRLAQ